MTTAATAAPAASGSRTLIAARKTLLGRQAKLTRLAVSGELDRRELSAGRGDQLAENEEIAGMIAELTERERLELAEIDAALARMDAGAWGQCEKCGGRIPRPRLAAMPEARTCVTCP